MIQIWFGWVRFFGVVIGRGEAKEDHGPPWFERFLGYRLKCRNALLLFWLREVRGFSWKRQPTIFTTFSWQDEPMQHW